ncbi:LLM class flavin-dependent oxidoreductase [Occultella glacieicola]|uniref:LLM class flavin-dependent oxidoreductase n=1 Tax=Occultella glacieicola TaxID=2518684 RepID=A0ABY2E9D6_9MICO|nr:LLM class flavin-dependent oxidoreductase [Occultella glacieicola]TDE99001.1 LLM class flavin-dependent oxidoreductase [Occultella glacieicola]
MDYGHHLEFGAFVNPDSADPAGVVDLARRAEELGLDLVTVQDHPYQPALLETWTLLSWIAGSTDRIRIAPNVLNMAIRPPAVLARAAASLDLLSGGRLELGLGAGHFWDAIAAMGTPRLSPGESVDALTEAIELLRAVWAGDASSPLEVPGAFHALDGAQGGPAPAHTIPLWIGALKPRMQRLIGAKADGWWPSLGRLAPGDLAAGNAVIDTAATEAGRDPREIRRLLNITGSFGPTAQGELSGPPSAWVEQLLPYVLDDGVGTFVYAASGGADLERFATEVAPALREAVAAERHARSTPVGAVVPLAVRAKRREGIDYDTVPAALAATAVEPGHAGFAGVRNTYLRGGSPGLVLRPGDADEVAQALAFARSQPVPLAVRSAGHGISGRSTNDGGIVIDLSRLNGIEVLDVDTRRVRIEPGARWGEVAQALHPHGWALSSGDFGGVGVGGLATAGGIGWLGRKHGLTIDHLRAVEIVLADGALVRADAEHHPDLFWAVRGAGANLGIVTAFEFEVDEVGDVGFAQLVFDAGNVATFLENWGALQEAAPRDLTSFLIIGRPRGGQVVATVMATVDSDDPDTVISRLQPFATLGPLLQQAVQILPYPAIVATPDGGQHGQGEPATRSALVEHLTPEFAAAAAKLIHSGVSYFFQIRSVGGAVADVPPEETAYAHRSANFSVTAFGAGRTRLDAVWDTQIQPHANGLYLSFETDPRPERIADAFPPATLARLREIKARVDPENVFRDNFNVAPAEPGITAVAG